MLGSSASAQLSNLDDAQFIQGLRERGMKQLMLYYLQKHPPKDPVQRMEIEIERQRLIYEDPKESPDRRGQAALDTLKAYRDLIEKAPADHWKQPIWKVDMVEFILEQVLPVKYVNASLFAEFGQTTKDQQAHFDELVAEAADMMERAGDDLFQLEGNLPRRKDFELNYVNNGRWDQLRKTIGQLRLPYYRAWAYYESTLMSKPKNAKSRLAQADRDLEDVIKGKQLNPVGESRARSLLGRVILSQGKADSAINHLDAALRDAPKGSIDMLTILLAKAQALHQLKKDKDAVTMLDQIAKTEPATTSPILLILVYDCEYLITKDEGVYPKLFNSPEAAKWKPLIEKYVNDRIVEQSAGAPTAPDKLAGESPLKVLAKVEAMVASATQKKADAAKASGDQAKQLKHESAEEYKSAIATLTDFLKRDKIEDDMRAQAMFKLGVANYQAGQLFDAAKALIELAEKYPKDPQARQGAEYGVQLMQEIYNQHKTNEQAIDWYRRGLIVLLDKFPDDPLAVKMQYNYAAFLREQKDYAKAIEAYAKVSPKFQYYPDAQLEALDCHMQLWRAVEPKKRADAARDVITFADQAINKLDQAETAAGGKRKTSLLSKEGNALLDKVELLAGSGQSAQAYTLLQNFDQKYGQFAALISSKRQMAIGILVQLGRVDEARTEIVKYIDQHPNEGGPMIKAVLDKINQQTDDARLREAPDEARRLADIGVDLGQFLVNWAKKQPQFASDPAKMFYFQCIQGEQLINAQQFDEATKLYEDMFKQPGGDKSMPVIYGLARTYYLTKKYDQAKPLINKILNLAPDKDSPVVWNCWLMRLTIRDTERQALVDKNQTKDAEPIRVEIFTTIKRLQQFNADLGGPQLKPQFQKLLLRNQPK